MDEAYSWGAYIYIYVYICTYMEGNIPDLDAVVIINRHVYMEVD